MAENDFTVNFGQDDFQVVFGEQGPQGPSAAAVPYDATEVFEIGAIVYDTEGNLFGSTSDDNVGNPLSDTDFWTPLGVASGVVTQLNDLTDVTLTNPVNRDSLTYDGTSWVNSASQDVDWGSIKLSAFAQQNTFAYKTTFEDGDQRRFRVDAATDPGVTGYNIVMTRSGIDTARNLFQLNQIRLSNATQSGTYAVSNVVLESPNSIPIATISVSDIPLGGDDILATSITDGSTFSIFSNQNVNEFGLDDLHDVVLQDLSQDQVLVYDGSVWRPQDQQDVTITDYNDASYGSIDDGSRSWTYNAVGTPTNEGEVSFQDDGASGYTLQFRTQDIDTINSVSVSEFQIGYGSPITFATYSVADLSIADDFVSLSLVAGPLDGDNILATFPADGTALSISVSVRQFRLPLSGISDVSDTAPTNGQTLVYNSADSSWEPADAASGLSEGFGIDITSDVINWDASPNEVRAAGDYSMVSQWTEDTAVGDGQFAFLTAETGFDYQLQLNKNNGDGDVVLDDASVAIILGSTISLRSATGNGYYYVEEQGESIAAYDFNLRFLSGNDILLGEPADLIIAIFSSTETLLATETTPGFIPVLSGVATEFLNGSGEFSTPAGNGGATTLNGLTDVHAPAPVDGYVIRYVDSNDRWEEHSLNDTMRLYGGIDMDIPSDFTIPSATGVEAIAVGYNASASQPASIAIGRDSIASHENSTAIGENATTIGNNEVRLGGENVHVTIDTNLAGTETFENQLASVKYVKDAVSDASRIVTDSVNGIYFGVREELADPWATYEIDPYLADAVTRQVATSVQFYDYSNENTNTFEAGVFQRVSTSGDQNGGSDLTNNTIPAFFEEQTDVQTDNNIGAVGGEDSTCLGWKYVGYQDAKVWMANPIGVPIQLRWVNHDPNNASVSVPQVGIRMEWVRVKPQAIGDATVYDLSDNDFTTSLGGTTNQYYTHGTTIAPGDTQAHDITFVLPTQTFSDAVTISDDDVIAFRYVIFFHGNEFSSDPANNTGLSLDIYWEALGSNNPMFGIETVDVSDQLVMESTGDLRYTDNISGNDLLLIDNVGGVPEIPAGTLGLTGGTGIDITGKTIALDANVSDLADTDINDAILSNNQVLTWNEDTFEGDAWRAVSFDIDILGDTVISTPSDGQVLTFEASDQTWRNQSIPSASTTLAALTDVTLATPTDGQVITYNNTTSMWENTSLSGNHSFTAGTGLSFNSEGTVLNYDGVLSDVADVNLSGLEEFQVISYNPLGDGSWENVLYNVIPYSNISVQSIDSRPSFLGTATRTVLIGPNTVSTASSATAVGFSAAANGASGSAYGDNSSASGINSVAVGHDANGSGASSVAVGDDADATSTNAIAIGNDAGSAGTNSIAIGDSAGVAGDRAIAIGSDPSTADNPLAIAIGERAQVTGTRGIAIGSSSNSADDNADLVTAAQSAVAIGRAASATAVGSTAIGSGASATIENSTVLGDGSAHRLFTGNREIIPSTEISRGAADITCSTNNEFFTGGFNPTGSSNELLNYTEIGNLVMGRFEFTLATTTQPSNFAESDRWSLNSTSIAMRDAFGFSVGSSAIPMGTFVISGSAYNSAAMGDFWLHPDSSLTNIIMSFRVRSVIGTPPSHDAVVSAQFTFAKF